MNILFLSTRFPYPPKSGHFQRSYNVLRHLASKHRVYLVSFFAPDTTLAERQEGLAEIGGFCAECHTFNVPMEHSKLAFLQVVASTVFSNQPLIAKKYNTEEMADCIRDICDRTQIDFVHYDMLPMVEYGPLLSGYPSLLTEHNVEYYRYERWIDKEKNPLKRLFVKKQFRDLKRYEGDVVGRFPTCVVMSDDDGKVLAEHAPETRFVTVPNGTDIDYFVPGEVERKPHSLIWVGGMGQWTNRDAVEYFYTDILPLVMRQVPEVEFDVIGNWPSPMLSSGDASKNVNVHGFVDDIRNLVAEASLYVAPIRIGSGTKLKILDAMAMGKCVITTSVGIEGIHAVHDEEVFVRDDASEFAQTVLELLADPDLADRVGKRARERVCSEYSWPSIFRKMDALYE